MAIDREAAVVEIRRLITEAALAGPPSLAPRLEAYFELLVAAFIEAAEPAIPNARSPFVYPFY